MYGGQGRIRTFVPRKEGQIYSLLALTTHPPVRNGPDKFEDNMANYSRQTRIHILIARLIRDSGKDAACGQNVCLRKRHRSSIAGGTVDDPQPRFSKGRRRQIEGNRPRPSVITDIQSGRYIAERTAIQPPTQSMIIGIGEVAGRGGGATEL